jgi:glycosyltransferase involved in cell wall biosynthesis
MKAPAETSNLPPKPSGALRIGYVLKRFPHLSQTFILNEILELERQGVQVYILSLRSPRGEPTHGYLKNLRAQITYLDETSTPSDKARAEQVALWAKARAIDHLHAHFATSAAEIAMRAANLAKITYSFTAHARDIYHEAVDHKALLNRIAHAAFVVTVSDYNRDYLENLLAAHHSQGKVIRLYNGLDLELFNPEPSLRQSGLVVSVGRLVAKKGMNYLIEACADLRNRGVPFRCMIVGDGEERESLQGMISKLNLEPSITLIGALTQSDVIDIINQADIFVLPCIIDKEGDRDGLPTVILEAMALNTPVISTRLSGIPEMIHDHITGLLVEPQQVEDLANAMTELLGSEELKQMIRVNARQHMTDHFDIRKNVAQLIEQFFAAKSINSIPECA